MAGVRGVADLLFTQLSRSKARRAHDVRGGGRMEGGGGTIAITPVAHPQKIDGRSSPVLLFNPIS